MINTTFRELLLKSPSSINQNAYAAHFNQMFPDVEHFEHFLQSSRHEEQVRYARLILLRLASESALSPTNRLILNLLDFESSIGQRRADGFVGRDHFVHLVHLYLLGLFIFWYHNAFHNTILEYVRSRRTQGIQAKDKNISADPAGIGLFLTLWTHFVLLHDTFYPLELHGGNETYAKFIEPLGKVSKNLEKEYALQCLARLVSFQMLLDSTKSEIFEDRYQMDFKSGTFRQSQGQLWEMGVDILHWHSSERMPSRLGASLIAFLKCVVTEGRLLLVLERTSDGRPVWLFDTGTKQDIFLEDNLKQSKSRDRLTQMVSTLKSGGPDLLPSEEFELSVFARDIRDGLSQAYVRCTGDGIRGETQIKTLATSYATSDPVPFDLSSAYRDFNDCVFHTYYSILRDLDYLADEEDIPSSVARLNQRFKVAKRAIQGLEQRIVKELQGFLSSQVKARFKFLQNNAHRVSNEQLDAYLHELLLPFSDADKLIKTFSSRMSKQLKRQIETDSVLRDVYKAIRKQIARDCSFSKDTWGEGSVGCQRVFCSEWMQSKGAFLKALEALSRTSGLSSSAVNDYRPEYVEANILFVDHGIGAAALTSRIGERILAALSKHESQRNAPFAIATCSRERIFGCEEFVNEELCLAIMVHNLYPEHFAKPEDQQFRIRMSASPFAYFSVLCDSLQPWDRKRLVNPTYIDGAYGTLSDEFDLVIRNNTIYISEEGYGLSIEDRLNALKRHLDHYIEAGSKLVKLRLSEK